jgi:GntR family transcriptional regulator/MocR family aminotransferase
MRRTYEDRKSSMLADLIEIKESHPKISWTDPDGGMALWLNLNQDSLRISQLARSKGIYINPESNYCLQTYRGTHLRLGFSGQSPNENRAGLNALSKLL